MIRKAKNRTIVLLLALLGVGIIAGSAYAETALAIDASNLSEASYVKTDNRLGGMGGGSGSLHVSLGCLCPETADQALCLVTASGGSGGYHYGWISSGAGNLFPAGSTANFTNCTGNVTIGVTVTDSSGAKKSATTSFTCSSGLW